ncbi:MAG: T9SS type A sorting domain-containing protein, partial [Bacteroidia bacterium]
LLFLLLFPIASFGQSTYFEKVFGSTGNDISRSVKQLSSGSIYVLGNSDSGAYGGNDISLTKLDSHGNAEWTNYYGTPNTENGFYLNTTADGNFVFVGESETSTSNLDIFIYKVDTTGAVIWNKIYATPVNETGKYIEQTSDGGYIIAGSQNDAYGFYDILALKLDSAGNYQWHQTYGRDQNEYGQMIHQRNNNYILTGDTKSYGAGDYDVILYNLDSSGVVNWAFTYGDSLQNGCQGVLITSSGDYLSYGETEIFPFSAFNFYLEKIDTNGTSMWRKTFGGTGADAIFSVKEDADGGFICTGYSNSYNGGSPLDLVILKTDAAGNFLWKQTYGGPGIDIGYEIIKSVDDNGFIITGKTFTTDDEYYLLKLDTNGIVSGIQDRQTNLKSLSDAFPNPCTNQVSIKYNLETCTKKVNLVLTDILGNVIKSVVLDSSKKEVIINVSDLNSGIYFYSLEENDKIISTKKLIITSQ